jgi:hypothetical protein
MRVMPGMMNEMAFGAIPPQWRETLLSRSPQK